MKTVKRFKFLLASVLAISIVLFIQPKASIEADAESKINERLKDAIVLYIGSPVAFVDNNKTYIDPSNQEVIPTVKNERTLVPVRFISENLGAKVDWDEKTKEVSLDYKGKKVGLALGKNKMFVNNDEHSLEAPAELIGARTFVPLRAVTEAFDKKVFYQRGLIIISDKDEIININKEQALIDEIITRVNVLPSVTSEAHLRKLLEKVSKDSNRYGDVYFKGGILSDSVSLNSAQKSESAVVPQAASKAKDSDYSSTNVQVEGVDEADIIKNDGEYIYQVNKQRVVVIKAYPETEMKVVSVINFSDKNFNPQELYLDEKNLVVIGSTYKDYTVEQSLLQSKLRMIMPQRSPTYRTRSTVKAIVYDISEKTNLKETRQVEVEGNYISSRKIGSSLYLVSNKNINYYYIQNYNEGLTPLFRDTAVQNGYISVKCPDIRYFPGFEEPNYMMVAGMDLNKNEPAKVSTYLGAGENIYVSTENMYVAATRYEAPELKVETMNKIMPIDQTRKTLVYKFGLSDGMVNYKSKGEVPGSILNQFSMDEHNDYLRIATTVGEVWRNDEYTSKNNVYILDKELNISGKIENIAPGEKIYSTRFMGDRGYMVTFKTVDPLFVIDLKDPKDPKILGALKIPGYSDYLHPYDENHIIGFGKDTTEVKEQYGTRVLADGMKIALFDVSDVNNPKEKFKTNIGDRGTYSELLQNHKALLFSKEKNLMAFPVAVMEIKKQDPNNQWSYGEFAFQGAYVYNIDLQSGFKLKGKITHIPNEEYQKAGMYGYYGDRNVERIIYIKDKLYTLSKGMIKANDLESLAEKKAVVIE